MSRSPSLKARLAPQPAISSRCSADSSSNTPHSSSSSLIVRMLFPLGRADGCDLLGDVDGGRAPCDAAAAAHAARRPELVDPRPKLVGHPLAVAPAGRAPHAAPVDVGMAEREARVPHADALGLLAREVGEVL